MIQNTPEANRPGRMLLLLVLFVVVGNLLALLLFTPVAYAVPGFREMLFEGAPQSAAFLRTMMFVSIPVTFLLPAWYVQVYSGVKSSRSFVGLTTSPQAKWIFGAMLLVLACQPFLNLIGDWNKHLVLPDTLSGIEEWMRHAEQQAGEISKRVTDTHSPAILFLNVLIIGVMTGFCEEYLFRGVVQNAFLARIKNPHVAIWLTAFIFSFVHFQFYGFLPRLVLGVLLGYLAFANGSLWPSVVAHIFNNSAVVIILFLQHNGYMGSEIDTWGIGSTAWVGLLSLILSVVLFKLLSAKNQ